MLCEMRIIFELLCKTLLFHNKNKFKREQGIKIVNGIVSIYWKMYVNGGNSINLNLIIC